MINSYLHSLCCRLWVQLCWVIWAFIPAWLIQDVRMKFPNITQMKESECTTIHYGIQPETDPRHFAHSSAVSRGIFLPHPVCWMYKADGIIWTRLYHNHKSLWVGTVYNSGTYCIRYLKVDLFYIIIICCTHDKPWLTANSKLCSLQALDTTLFIDIGIYTHLVTQGCYNEGS